MVLDVFESTSSIESPSAYCPNDFMICPNCQKPVEADWATCPNCDALIASQHVADPVIKAENPYASPVTSGMPDHHAYQPQEGDATGGVIPYKNPKALIAYYLGLLSGLPLIGLPLGLAAFILGILGLKERKRNPAIKGSAHAWIGIGCGGLFAILWGVATILIFVSLIANK